MRTAAPFSEVRSYIRRKGVDLTWAERRRDLVMRCGRRVGWWASAPRAALLVAAAAAAAEAIAQEAFLAAIRNLNRFDRRRPFGPWLHRIVVNRAIDWTRARRLRAEVELGEH